MAQQPTKFVSQALDLIGLSALIAAAGALVGALYLQPAAPIAPELLLDMFLGAIATATVALLAARVIDIASCVAEAPLASQRRAAPAPVQQPEPAALPEPAPELPRAA